MPPNVHRDTQQNDRKGIISRTKAYKDRLHLRSSSENLNFSPRLNPHTTSAAPLAINCRTKWRISDGTVRLFNLFTVRQPPSGRACQVSTKGLSGEMRGRLPSRPDPLKTTREKEIFLARTFSRVSLPATLHLLGADLSKYSYSCVTKTQTSGLIRVFDTLGCRYLGWHAITNQFIDRARFQHKQQFMILPKKKPPISYCFYLLRSYQRRHCNKISCKQSETY